MPYSSFHLRLVVWSLFLIAGMGLPSLRAGSAAPAADSSASGVTRTANGARLRAEMQDLAAEATPEGLWLTSTADGDAEKPNRFRVRAVGMGRTVASGSATADDPAGWRLLADRGRIGVGGDTVAWARPGLVEEYTVSSDGVRQDFLVLERPHGSHARSKLALELEVCGAQAEAAAFGARLTLDATGRELAYSRLKVTDAAGHELSARLETVSARRLRVVVDDAAATYPVRIDPTFSDADWISMGGIPGANATVRAMAADGAGNLYVGGNFTVIGNVEANRIAKWNGNVWSALGSGVNGVNGYVYALAVSGSDLYAGGEFTTAGGVSTRRIAKWNGSAWSALGSGMTGGSLPTVNALAVSGSALYAGGVFTSAGGVAASRIAKWDGSAWSALGTGVTGGTTPSVNALVVSGTTLYAGGAFTSAGGVAASRTAKWDGSAWSALGTGVSGAASASVSALAVSGNTLYAGGDFYNAGGVSVGNVAAWNGSAWSALGDGVEGGAVKVLMVSGSSLYAGGAFDLANWPGPDTLYVNYLARWDGTTWSALGSRLDRGLGYSVSALALIGSDLYAGGNFNRAGGVVATHIAKWNGSAWSPMGSGISETELSASVQSLAVSGGNLYAGGRFTTVGGVDASSIAKWNGSGWTALGYGTSGESSLVAALAVIGSDLFVAGEFGVAGELESANKIARWNGTAWNPLGSGMNYPVSALAASGSNLYAGGEFTTAGGAAANFIARWDGSAWSALGTGMNHHVHALAVSGNTLYAGGRFTTAGGVTVNGIAKWNGTEWSALGSGISGGTTPIVSALAVSGNILYAGGVFTTAGGVPVNNIAKWNGTSWSALGSGVNYDVYALAVNGSDLYVGGGFDTAGGVPAKNIAKWDGTAWSALGSGTNSSVAALALDGSNLYAGGFFTTAGSKVSAYLARANLAGALGRDLPATTLVKNGGTLEFRYSRAVATLNAGVVFSVEWSDTLAAGSWSTSGVTETILSTAGGVQQVQATLPAGTAGRRAVRLRLTVPAGG